MLYYSHDHFGATKRNNRTQSKIVTFRKSRDGKPVFVRSMLRRAAEKPKLVFEYKKRRDLLKQLHAR